MIQVQKGVYTVNEKMTELKSNNEGNEKINKATALIEKYMNDGEYPQELDEEIKDLIQAAEIYLKQVLADLEKITGDDISEDIINEIFSKFCLGK